MKTFTFKFNRLIKLSTLLLMILLLAFYADVAQGQSTTYERVNVGLYGGASTDFAYDTNYRLFSTVESPGSLFYSDDTCKTWTQAFPIDSLEYNSNQRGWSGGRRVLTNRVGWVGVETAEAGGTLESTVISYDDGDSGTFVTAFDNYLLKQISPAASMESPDAIDLTDHWFYVAMDHYLLRTNDTATLGSHNIILDMDTVALADTSTHIMWISAANTTSGYPLLLVVRANMENYARLLKYDGTTFTEIAHPVSTFDYYFREVFSHPADTSMDTIIVSTKEPNIQTIKVFSSLNGGGTWNDITPSGGTNWPLQNADYSPHWASSMPVSNGLRLSFPGGTYSTDLGGTWSAHFMEDNATAANPYNPNIIICSKNKGPQVSYDYGTSFANPDNEGHAAVSISKIAQLRTNTYYVATKAGLGYTIAYHNNAVLGVNKWRPPYGDFPIAGVGDDGGVSAVDIDPNDSLHVVVGYNNGFYVTTTGPTGFTQVTPSDWGTGTHRDYMVTDVQFITSDTIVAVTGTGSNVWPSLLFDYGNIWLSTDGGSSWTKQHPTDGGVTFEQGNSVAVGYGPADTIIFIGCGYWDHDFPTVNGQLWRSTDFGLNWEYLNTGPTSQMAGSTVDSMPIYDLDVYPGTVNTLYFASGENLDYAFAKSTDGGNTYSYINNMMPEGAFSAVLIHPDGPDIVSVSARRDLWRTNTIFNSTTLVFEGLPGEFVPDLEYGSTLMGTSTGLYKVSETPGSIVTIWNGDGNWSDPEKWSNGIPYNICKAIIDSGMINVDMDGETYELIMKPMSAMTINAGKTVNVSGDFTLKSDDSATASFIDEGTINVSGTITVERYISEDQWHYFASPVTNSTAAPFTGMWVKYWDESTKDWVYITNASDPLLSGKGYASWSNSGSTGNMIVEYTGNLNTGDYSPTISLSGDPELDYGWNLVGNAYPSAFDWDNTNITKTNIDNTVYYWDGTQYLTYNGTTHTGSTGISQYVPSQQGFFIHANASNPQLTITQDSRTHNPQKFLKASSTGELFRLFVRGNNYKDETMVLFNEDATNGFDNDFDAYKLAGIDEAPQLYSYVESEETALNTQPFDGPVETVSVGFKPGLPGTFTISCGGIENFPEDMVITLEDAQTGQITNLRNSPSYTFNGTPGDNIKRFVLTFDATMVGTNAPTEPNSVEMYVNNSKQLVINGVPSYSSGGKIQIYDMLDRLRQSELSKGISTEYVNLTLNSGMYIAVFKDNNRAILKKLKFIIK